MLNLKIILVPRESTKKKPQPASSCITFAEATWIDFHSAHQQIYFLQRITPGFVDEIGVEPHSSHMDKLSEVPWILWVFFWRSASGISGGKVRIKEDASITAALIRLRVHSAGWPPDSQLLG
ncbi:hypothetical protein NPIL_703561 [Nephila pilipes]|uniref:Uncharacterized protein n=1 Tax=Nephila pilipes TaxID=299642 RepID=A0A8X6MV72_NEPPI|nr:hypothetical protein NPIL_703561 [Nephila pilipes]